MASVPDMPLQGLYGDKILDHYRNPRLRTPLDNADVEAEEFNPFCGDRVILQLSVDRKGLVANASARSEGCSIIQASASMLAQMTLGKSLEQVESVADRFRSMMQRKPAPGEDMVGLEELAASPSSAPVPGAYQVRSSAVDRLGNRHRRLPRPTR